MGFFEDSLALKGKNQQEEAEGAEDEMLAGIDGFTR